MAQTSNAEKLQNNNGLNQNQRPFGMRDKIGYMFGDFGNDFFFLLVASFLMVYYTDVLGISASLVGLILLIARVWDAFADVTWGRFMDTRKATKHGKYKPWFYRMSFPMVLFGILMFVQIPGMSSGFYTAFAFITYLIWGTLFSTVNMPYGSMASVISNNPIDRASLSTFRTVGAMMASLIVNAIGPLVLFVNNEASGSRFFMISLVFAVLSVICFTLSYKLTTERVTMAESEEQKLDIRSTLKGVIRNKPLIILLAASLTFLVLSFLMSAVNVYLFKNYFGFAGALSFIGIIQPIAVFILAPAVKPLVIKFGKKEIAAVGLLVASIVYGSLYFMNGLSPIQFIAISTIGLFGFAIFNLVIWAFVTDAIDYQEYITGNREDATVYSIYSFARKIGQALAGGLGGVVIGAVGYNANLPEQTKETLDGIYMLGTLVPSVLCFVVFLLLLVYPLNKKGLAELSEKLEIKRRAKL
ncbi:TPA: MFS transporter [Bacillus luti]|nr:MFS transporter [Bacillus luti]